MVRSVSMDSGCGFLKPIIWQGNRDRANSVIGLLRLYGGISS